MKLLFDLGNTRCKWATAAGGHLGRSGALTRGDDIAQRFRTLITGLEPPEAVYGISVAAPEIWAALVHLCREHWGIEAHELVTPSEGGGVKVAYTHPRSLGTDRWAAMVGAAARHMLPACVIDCGTALTVDVVGASGHHRGGLILPGLSTMRRSLSTGTHALPSVNDGPVPLLANNTSDAIRAGTLRGLAATVDGLYEQLSRELGEPLSPVITGGDAGTLLEYLRTPFHIAPDLILEGIAHYVEGAHCGSS